MSHANQWSGPEPLADRFWRKVDRSGDCWLWMGARAPEGYGRVNIDRRAVPTHRVAYELTYGAIPAGLHIDHLCRVTSCVNPAHLEAVTNRTNAVRGVGWAGVNARKTHCPRGHAYSPGNTYLNPRRTGLPSRRCRECSRSKAQLYYLRRKKEQEGAA